MRSTTIDELYSVYTAFITSITGRPCWRKAGIQAQPNSPYALIYIQEGPSPAIDVREVTILEQALPTGETIQTTVWGNTRLECKVEFFRDSRSDPAINAAIKFRNSLQLEDRFWDLWTISGLIGEIRLLDVSTVFRADTEGRAEVKFNLYANLSTTSYTYDIHSQHIGLILQPQDVLVEKDITNPQP